MTNEIKLLVNQFPNLYLIFIFIFGTMIGSFLNVCIYRIPLKKSVIYPPSQCKCRAKIAWYDNIPIISWFLLKGRCRHCSERISKRYPLVEALTGFLFILYALQHSDGILLAGLTFIAIMICATFIDLDHMIIPDRFTIGGFFTGIVLSFIIPDIHAYGTESMPWFVNGIRASTAAIIGGCAGSGIILWIALFGEIVFRKEVMGFGDVKFMGCIGAFLGWKGAIFAIFGGALLGSIILVPLLGLQSVLKIRLIKTGEIDSSEGGGTTIPFGPWLSLGALTYLLWLKQPVDEYFDTLAVIFNY